MEILLACCAGLDVHKDSVQVWVREMEAGRGVRQQTRQWGTTTRALLEMLEWLKSEGVTHVAMESTGVYWKPIFNVLENDFEVLLVNARTVKHVPGRKTDVADCQWIAPLLQHGLLHRDTEYQDLGKDFLDHMREKQLVRFHVKRLQQLGLDVTLIPAVA